MSPDEFQTTMTTMTTMTALTALTFITTMTTMTMETMRKLEVLHQQVGGYPTTCARIAASISLMVNGELITQSVPYVGIELLRPLKIWNLISIS